MIRRPTLALLALWACTPASPSKDDTDTHVDSDTDPVTETDSDSDTLVDSDTDEPGTNAVTECPVSPTQISVVVRQLHATTGAGWFDTGSADTDDLPVLTGTDGDLLIRDSATYGRLAEQLSTSLGPVDFDTEAVVVIWETDHSSCLEHEVTGQFAWTVPGAGSAITVTPIVRDTTWACCSACDAETTVVGVFAVAATPELNVNVCVEHVGGCDETSDTGICL